MDISTETQNNINLISCYFIDVFYNHLYKTSIDRKNKGEYKSITDSYKNIIYEYKRTFAPAYPEHLEIIRHTINQLYEYYVHITGRNLTFSNWYDMTIRDFVPLALIDNLNSTQKSSIITKVVIDIIDKITVNIVDNSLIYVIDERNPDSVDFLIKTTMDIIIIVREKHFNKFFNS